MEIFMLIPFGGYVKFFGDHNVFSDFNREELENNIVRKIKKNY